MESQRRVKRAEGKPKESQESRGIARIAEGEPRRAKKPGGRRRLIPEELLHTLELFPGNQFSPGSLDHPRIIPLIGKPSLSPMVKDVSYRGR